MSILTNLVWRFRRSRSFSIDQFNDAINLYQKDILKDKASWNPNAIVINSATVGIQYSAWITSSSELVDNEILIGNKYVPEGIDNQGNRKVFQADILIELDSDNERNFSALELMYKIDSQLSAKDLGDHVYFEGLQEIETNSGFPSFLLRCGS